MKITFLKTDAEKKDSFKIMKQLVSKLEEKSYLKQIKRKEKFGYKLLAIKDKDKIISLAGIRFYEYFGCGKFIIIDDFVTNKKYRKLGFGTKLFDWIKKYAKKENCSEIQLNSSIKRHKAHKFYKKQGMKITNYHFTKKIN